jgi:hypothetical protein
LKAQKQQKPAKVKEEDAEQDDDILKHYTKEARDKERSVDNGLKNLVRQKKGRKLEELKERSRGKDNPGRMLTQRPRPIKDNK